MFSCPVKKMPDRKFFGSSNISKSQPKMMKNDRILSFSAKNDRILSFSVIFRYFGIWPPQEPPHCPLIAVDRCNGRGVCPGPRCGAWAHSGVRAADTGGRLVGVSAPTPAQKCQKCRKMTEMPENVRFAVVGDGASPRSL